MGWREQAARTEAEIEAEIRDELEFHLEQRTRALVEQGLTEEEARTEAERRFGSLERVEQSCRKVQLGERIMLQRIQLVLNLVLVSAVLVLGGSLWFTSQRDAHVLDRMQSEVQRLSALLAPRAAELGPRDAPPEDPLLLRFGTLKDARGAAELAAEIAALLPERGRQLLCLGWSRVTDPELRRALLEPFVARGGHAEAIQILHFGATDPDPRVREEAFRHLRGYAWQDFAGMPASIYHEWYAEVGALPLGEALSRSAVRYAERLRANGGPALVRELGLIEEIDLEPARLRGRDVLHDIWWSGGEDHVGARAVGWLASANPELQLAALRFVAHFPLDADFVVVNVVGFLQPEREANKAHTWAACRVLARSGQVPLEPDSVPALRLLRLCVEDDGPSAREVVGAGVLAPLLGLAPDPQRTASQWLAWWKENRAKVFNSRLLQCEDARWLDQR